MALVAQDRRDIRLDLTHEVVDAVQLALDRRDAGVHSCALSSGSIPTDARARHQARVPRPSTIDEPPALLDRYGDEGKVLAGGQSLISLLMLRFAGRGRLIDINRIAGLDTLAAAEGALRIGPLVRNKDCASVRVWEVADAVSRKHSANFTALSRAVSFLVPPVPALLAVSVLLAVPVLPFSADPFEQPAPISATRGKGGQRPWFLLMLSLRVW